MAFVLPRPLSHSSISMYNECPQKYKFKYVDKIPEKPRHFFSFGKSVHDALEFFYGVKALPAPTLDELLAYYRDHWINEGYKDEDTEKQYFQDGKEILGKFYKKHIQDFHIPFFVEYSFDLEVDGVPVTGKVDRIDKLPDGRISILDYKTGKALASARVQTDAQLTMYQLACEKLLGVEVAKLSFYHLPSLKEQVVERHDSSLVDALRKRIVGTAESISKGSFEPRPEERKCMWCDYKPLCPIFRHQFSAPPVAAAAVEADADLAALIDFAGELEEQSRELAGKLAEARGRVLSVLAAKGYVRAFGKRFEAQRQPAQKWEFIDKKKVLDIIKQSGLYERILAPSSPRVEALMADPAIDAGVRARLAELGDKADASELTLKPLG